MNDPDLITIVSYNAQNLFDAKDSGLEYPEFTIKSGTWSESKYRRRLDNTSRSVLSLMEDGAAGPDILCLVEVENASVLEDLRKGPFARAGYSFAVMAPSTESPINNGILSRFPAKEVKAHSLECIGSVSRYMLEASFSTTPDTNLTIFLCHWKSRREGAESTEETRIQAAALLKSRIRSILSAKPEAEILVCGDFNESPDEYSRNGSLKQTAFMPHDGAVEKQERLHVSGDSVTDVSDCHPDTCRGILVATRSADASFSSGTPVMYSPWNSSGGYSYVFEGKKERLDGFLLSPGLCDGSGLGYSGFRAASAEFLVSETGQPLAWRGTSGFSDHLPILLVLTAAR